MFAPLTHPIQPGHRWLASSNRIRLVPLVILGLLLLGCRPQSVPPAAITATPPPTTLNVGLTSSAARLESELSDPFSRHTDRAHLQFVVANTATLLADLADGELDAVLVHQIPAGNSNWFNPIALDSLVLIVHPDNPVRDLALVQVQGLYSGRITNWQEVGGHDRPVRLVSRERGSGSRDIFRQRLMGAQRVSINALVAPGQAAVLEAVAGDPGAIGYVMMGSLTEDVIPLTLQGEQANPATAAAQSYPLTVPLYFLNAGPDEPAGELRLFLAWLQSSDGQAILGEKYGRVR